MSSLTQKHFRIRRQLRPIFPYIDLKANSSLSLEPKAPQQPHAIDVDRLKLWLERCRTSHGIHCQAAENVNRRRPRRLIDAVARCIVDCEDHPYACLSYVWGAIDCGALKKSLIEELTLPDSLSEEYLPGTIADAVYLLPLLGLRYLWVDRLCIVQDDCEDVQVEISAMADIYAGSTITIVAANSSSVTAPLWMGRLVSGSEPSVKSTWRQADIKQQRCEPLERRKGGAEIAEWVLFVDGIEKSTGEFCDEAPEIASTQWPHNQYPHDDIMHMLSTDLIRSRWNDRGWTFQEWYSSHRRLVFHDQSVNWDCHCASWHEAQTDLGMLTTCDQKISAGVAGLNMERWPNWYRLTRLICQFNIRRLTYPEDVIDAFEGAMSSLSTVFSGGFISGLPRLFFDAALLWQPYAPSVQRRQPRLCEEADAVLPTWSWVAFHSNLDSSAAMAHLSFAMEKDTPWKGTRTISTVAWEHAASLDGPWEAVAHIHVDPGDGWLTMKAHDTGNEYFAHTLIPEQRFWYPVTICGPSAVTPTTTARSRFLRATTRYGKLLAEEDMRDLQSGHMCPILSLRDSKSRWAGFLRLGNYETAQSLAGNEVQLIELSHGETNNVGCPFLQTQITMVNVMCVVDRDGVFYRQAVGRVDTGIWTDEGISVLMDVLIG